MNNSIFKLFILIPVCSIMFLGDATRNNITLLIPFESDSLSFDQGKIVVVSVPKDFGKGLLVSTQWETEKVIDVNTKQTKDNFAKEFYKGFPPQTTIQMISYSYKFYNGWSKPETLSYKYSDTMSIRSFWQTPNFSNFLQQIQSTNGSMLLLCVKGWKDTLWSTTHDDSNDESRALFMLQLQLVPAENRIYFGVPGKKDEAYEYKTDFVPRSKPLEEREGRFHNSRFEQNCISCHEGLPGASNGQSMNAECGVCHKEKMGDLFTHGPATEPKDCSSLCHSWSPDKKSVIVTKGVPVVCYDCHNEKKDEISAANFKHKVAGDCATCHSPHSSHNPALLKRDVFRLCTSCHQSHKMNHPVDKHPLRFVKLNDKSNEELSCVSCHNPHGSENASLLKAGGGSMAVCMQCHQK